MAGTSPGDWRETDPRRILNEASSILLVDWPSRDVPDTLTRAGYAVFAKGGPEPDQYSEYAVLDGVVVARQVGHPPAAVDLVYAHRPVSELAGIVALARQLGATALWRESGQEGAAAPETGGTREPSVDAQRAREIVESAGLTYIDGPYIAGAVRSCHIRK